MTQSFYCETSMASASLSTAPSPATTITARPVLQQKSKRSLVARLVNGRSSSALKTPVAIPSVSSSRQNSASRGTCPSMTTAVHPTTSEFLMRGVKSLLLSKQASVTNLLTSRTSSTVTANGNTQKAPVSSETFVSGPIINGGSRSQQHRGSIARILRLSNNSNGYDAHQMSSENGAEYHCPSTAASNNTGKIELLQNRVEELEREQTELNEKHQKAMQLLTSILPASVCDTLLTTGHYPPPESFDMATIYFSDIVGFTTISSESTPLEVVNMLNALYTKFDDRIDIYDVYKVETIGDAYMLVSGCPRKNGVRHVGEIATLALDLQWMITDFRIPHMPDTKLKLRIGFHSGPTMAAIVGHKMPRYCLFGDTVNVASRMESTGKEFKIHLSLAAKELLDEIGGFETELRGDIEVKGKNLMTTYWLVGKEGFEFRIEKDVCEFIPKKRKRFNGRNGLSASNNPSLAGAESMALSVLSDVTEDTASNDI